MRVADQDKGLVSEVCKVDTDLGLVFGWGMVCTEKGAPYHDLQGDWIPDPVMLESTTDFMLGPRVAKDMHTGEPIGVVVHSWPQTAEIAEAFGEKVDRTGWKHAMKPSSKSILEQFRNGERTGFSIGGLCSYVEIE